MYEPKISIIIPVLNEEKTIGILLQHLMNEQYGCVEEILVVDAGSRDKTREIAEKLGARVILASRRGRAFQMNEGARAAQHDVLYFLHADTKPPLYYDLKIVREVKAGYIAGCFQLKFDDEHPLLKLYAKGSRLKTTLVRFGDQSLFVKKEAFEKVNGFDENLLVMEGQKIVRELKKAGKFKLLNDTVITSARKYREQGVIRLQLIFTLIWLAFYLGVPQDVLKHFYSSQLQKNKIGL